MISKIVWSLIGWRHLQGVRANVCRSINTSASAEGLRLHAIVLVMTPTEGARELTANMERGSRTSKNRPRRPRASIFVRDWHNLFSSLPLSIATVVERGSRLLERLWVGIWRASSQPILRLPDLLTWPTLGNRILLEWTQLQFAIQFRFCTKKHSDVRVHDVSCISS